jgi:hypothetical protein
VPAVEDRLRFLLRGEVAELEYPGEGVAVDDADWGVAAVAGGGAE